jgi:hypothetical protein
LVVRELSIEDYPKVIALWRQTEGLGLSDADAQDNIGRFSERDVPSDGLRTGLNRSRPAADS